MGVRVYGISRDSPWSHVAWREVLDLNFPLLSDWNGEATRAFGVAAVVATADALGSFRSAFIAAGSP